MSEQEDLFESSERSRRSAELQGFVAAFSRSPNSVLPDPSSAVEVTLSICELFLDADAPLAVTRGEIAAPSAGRRRRRRGRWAR